MSAQEEKFNSKIIDFPGRVQPQALDVEEAILCAMLIDETAVGKVVDILDETSFYKEAHRQIFLAMKALFTKAEPVDPVTVAEELRKMNQFDRVGGNMTLTALANKLPSASNVSNYSKIVIDKARLRKLITVGSDIVSQAFQETEDVDVLIDNVEKQIFEIAQDKSGQRFQELKGLLLNAYNQVDSFHNRPGGLTGVPSGYPSIDRITSGFQNSNLVILAARPGMGKTALVLNVARNAASLHKKPVGIFSLEMSAIDLVMRLWCAEADVDGQRLRTGMLSQNEFNKLHKSAGSLSQVPIYIDDSAGLNILDIRARARRLKAEFNIEMLIVDYMQLISANMRMGANRQEEVAFISRSLKALAKELNIPVIALSQLSRAVEQRGGDKRPQLSDLRDSGSIEQDADVVMFIHREDYYQQGESFSEDMPRDAEIIVAKHRNGPTDVAKLGWVRKYTKFVELDRIHRDPPPAVSDVEPAF